MNLADALLSQTHAAGTVIVRQGDAGDGMYFVEDGEVDVTMVGSGADNVEKHVTSLRQVLISTLITLDITKIETVIVHLT